MDRNLQVPQDPPSLRVRQDALIALAYLLVTWFTRPHFMGDTAGYAATVMRGGSQMWEFGHLIWRPFGWLLVKIISPVLEGSLGWDKRSATTLILIGVTWLSGLLAAVLMGRLLRLICSRSVIVIGLSVSFILTHAFLNFTETGCSYVAGLMFLMLGLYLLGRAAGDQQRSRLPLAILGGLLLAISVCFWFIYIWAIPAALVFPLLLSGYNSKSRRVVVQAFLTCGVTGVLVYAMAAFLGAGIHNLGELRAWVLDAGHGGTNRGLPRMVFGFARSFIDMGNDGVLFKRFLMKDPFNPVSLADLIRLSLWKLALFYVALAALVVNLLRSTKGRQLFVWVLLAAIPILVFAMLWQGGDIERYFPLYPAFFLAVAYSFSSSKSLRVVNIVVVLFLIASGVTSLLVMAGPVINRREAVIMQRLSDLDPLLKPDSSVITVDQAEELMRVNYDYPLNPFILRYPDLTYASVTRGTTQALRWREDVKLHVQSVWQKGGDIWLSKRLLEPQPKPDWNWVEGEGPPPWKELHQFYSSLEVENPVGGDDGFVKLKASEKNRALLQPGL